MSVCVMPSIDVYENFLKRSQAVAGGGHPLGNGQTVHLQAPSLNHTQYSLPRPGEMYCMRLNVDL